METACRWGHFDGSEPCPVPKDITNPMDTEIEAARHWDRDDQIARNLLNKWLPDVTMLEVRQYKTAKERWHVVTQEFMAKSAYARNALHCSFADMWCPKGGDVRAFLTNLKMRCNELLAAGVTISHKDFECTVLNGILDALSTYASQTLTSTRLNGNTLEMKDIIHVISEEADHTRNRRVPKDQSQGQSRGNGNKEGQPDKALAATSPSEGRNSRHCKGKCHHCGKEGHWVRECHTKKREEAEAAAAANQSSQAAQTTTTTPKPVNKPVGSANIAFTDDSDGDFWAAAVEVVHMHADRAGQNPWTGGLDWDNDGDYKVDIAPCVEPTPAPHNALHAPAATRTPASLGAPDEEEDHLQTVTLRGEHAVERQNQMLPERFWILWSALWAWLLKPLWGAALQILAVLEFSIEDLYQTPQVEGNLHDAQAGQLEGEEMRRLTAGSEQTAVPGTPPTFNAPKSPTTPSKATPPALKDAEDPDSPPVQVPRIACVPKPLRIVRKLNPQPGGGVAHPGSHDPHLAPRSQCPGAFVEDPGDSGGVPTMGNSAPAPLDAPDDTESAFAAETAGADVLDPRMHTEAKHAPDQPLWEATTEKSAACKACPVTQGLSHTGKVDNGDTPSTAPSLAGNPGPAHWAASKRIPFTLTDTPDPPLMHNKASSPLDSSPNVNGSTAEDWHATSGRASPIDSSTIPWPLKRQEDIPLPSTNEHNHVAAMHSSMEASWLCSLASMIFGNLKDPTTFIPDTPAATAPTRNHQHHPCTEHIDVQCHQPHQVVKEGLTRLAHRPSSPADDSEADAKERHFAASLGLHAK